MTDREFAAEVARELEENFGWCSEGQAPDDALPTTLDGCPNTGDYFNAQTIEISRAAPVSVLAEDLASRLEQEARDELADRDIRLMVSADLDVVPESQSAKAYIYVFEAAAQENEEESVLPPRVRPRARRTGPISLAGSADEILYG